MRRAPFLPSLAAAVAVPLWVLLVSVVASVIGGRFLPASVLSPLTLPLIAWSVALLLSFWLIAPITGGIRLRSVLWRSVIAAVIFVLVVTPAQFGVSAWIVSEVSSGESDAGGLYDLVPQDDASPARLLLDALVSTVQGAIVRLPLIVLAALGSWAWQRRRIHGEA